MVNSSNLFHGNTAIMYHADMYRYTTITKLVKLISAVTVVLNFTQNNVYLHPGFIWNTAHVKRSQWWTHHTCTYTTCTPLQNTYNIQHLKVQHQRQEALWVVTTLICIRCSVETHSTNCSCCYMLKQSHKPDWLCGESLPWSAYAAV
jgi:hypothetical protein